jgi:hypothetical protein
MRTELEMAQLSGPSIEELTTSISSSDGVVVITLSDANPGQSFGLERSTDGVEWTLFAEGETTAEGDLAFQDTEALGTLPRVLYRFVDLP